MIGTLYGKRLFGSALLAGASLMFASVLNMDVAFLLAILAWAVKPYHE